MIKHNVLFISKKNKTPSDINDIIKFVIDIEKRLKAEGLLPSHSITQPDIPLRSFVSFRQIHLNEDRLQKRIAPGMDDSTTVAELSRQAKESPFYKTLKTETDPFQIQTKKLSLADQCQILAFYIQQYKKSANARCINPSLKRQRSIDALDEKLKKILATNLSDLEKRKAIIAQIKMHMNVTLIDHKKGLFGCFTSSELYNTYKKALTAFPQTLVDLVPAAANEGVKESLNSYTISGRIGE